MTVLLQRARDWLRRLLAIKFVRDTLALQTGTLISVVVGVASSIILVRGLGGYQYGLYSLMLTMYGLLMTLNLTGLGPSATTQISEAVAAGDRDETARVMAFFIQMSLGVAVIATALTLPFAPGVAARSYDEASIGVLMQIYIFTLFFTPVHNLALTMLKSVRSMQAYTVFNNLTAVIDAALILAAILIDGTARGVVIVRLVSAIVGAILSLGVYARLQRRFSETLPTLGEVARAVRTTSPRPYWRFGFQLALDKNISQLYTLLPLQMLGMWATPQAAGYLRMALSALERPALFFSGILINMSVQVPADFGRREYARLRANFVRVLKWIVPLSVAVFGTFSLVAPLLVPLVYGEEYRPAVPAIIVLGVYGTVTGIGGIFGPLYRSLRIMRSILAVKVISLLVVALPSIALVRAWDAVGGAWSINLYYAVSIALTIFVTWPRVTRLAEAQATAVQGD